MKAQTKHRIIGGVVLLAVVAIFLPLLFHDSHPSTQLKVASNVPKPPQAPQVTLQLPPEHKTVVIDKFETLPQQAAQSQKPVILSTVAKPQQTTTVAMSPIPKEIATQAHEMAPSNSAYSNGRTAVASVNRTQSSGTILTSTKKTQASKLASKYAPIAIEQQQKTKLRKLAEKLKKPKINKAELAKTREVIIHSLEKPKAWVVQVGAFGNRNNAKHLIKRLRKDGYEAYARMSKDHVGKSLTRVYVGPEVKHNKVMRLQKKLKAQFHLNGVVRRYTL